MSKMNLSLFRLVKSVLINLVREKADLAYFLLRWYAKPITQINGTFVFSNLTRKESFAP